MTPAAHDLSTGSTSSAPTSTSDPRGSFTTAERNESCRSRKVLSRSATLPPPRSGPPAMITRVGSPPVWESMIWSFFMVRRLDRSRGASYGSRMGKVVEKIRVANWDDIAMAAGGARKAAPRSINAEALVDTGAGLFYLQTSLIKKLGLRQIDTVRSRTMSNLLEERRVFSPIELRI